MRSNWLGLECEISVSIRALSGLPLPAFVIFGNGNFSPKVSEYLAVYIDAQNRRDYCNFSFDHITSMFEVSATASASTDLWRAYFHTEPYKVKSLKPVEQETGARLVCPQRHERAGDADRLNTL